MTRLALAAAVTLTGCASFTTLQRADVLPEGKTRVGFTPLEVRGTEREFVSGPALPFVASVRRGVGHGVDVGGRFWLVGAGASVKWQFVRTTDLSVSVAPEAMAYVGRNNGELAYDLVLPVLAGLQLGEHQLIVGARVLARFDAFQRGTDELQRVTYPGGVLGFDADLGGGVHLLPELNVGYWPAGQEWFWIAAVGLYVDAVN